MTANQIAYASHLETQRHNTVTEYQNKQDVQSRAATAAANYWNAQTNAFKAQEDKRHNLASEEEIYRHNIHSEGIETNKLSETIRSNRENEQINWFKAQTDADYKYKQGESALRQATAAEAQAAAATQRAQTDASRLDIERYQAQSNRQNAVANSIQAGVAQQNATIREAELAQRKRESDELVRTHRANEGIQWAALAETVRSDKAGEYLSAQRNAETARTNAANEAIRRSDHMETVRHNMTTEGLTERDVTSRAKSVSDQGERMKYQNLESGANVVGKVFSAYGSLSRSIMGMLD